MTWGGIGPSGEFKTINHDGGGFARVDYEPARGDVSGLVDNLLVIRIQGRAISPLAPVSGEVLAWNGSAWFPSNMSVLISGFLPHNLLSSTHLDTVASSPTPGDLVAANSGIPSQWERFPIGTIPGQTLSVAQNGGLEWRDPNIVVPIIISSGSSFNAPPGNSRIIIAKPSGSPTSVFLTNSPSPGEEVIIKDGNGQAGNPFKNRVTIVPSSGTTIDGFTKIKITQNYGAYTLMWNGTEWNII